ncbi:Putative membrane protein mmpS4 [Actinoplanes sp. SE50]|uniref:Putative membrane protein mmpS4 n=1 Tax=unclassified Actinoplanes TaxID=2626549 RepID=UPI00023ED556|nr:MULTISPECIES: Putative membrane protein mmpS4 [unclassified Actinoplanes]AEV81734.1 Putative membrane protein mmpS4 [Actinoplanes sp. SE50/110]ATO80135.1 Putative membrane protein mmpS4 [Actinoplanes sp. SE50]SLL97539.1 Putative membrane protein mmpS4 [Actinoplanes sp. SE50/110]
MSDQRDPARDYPPTAQFAPVGYPPPDYRQHRRSNAPLIALILAITLLLCGGVITTVVLVARRTSDKAKETVQKIPTALPTPSRLPKLPAGGDDDHTKLTVRYEVSGDGPATIIYSEKLGLPKTVNEAKLPWKIAVRMDGLSFVSVSALRLSLQDGSITCKAIIDGKTVDEHTATGVGATATCNKLTFN